MFSCQKESAKEDVKLEKRTHTWTDSELATLDSVMYVFLSKDTTSLLSLQALLQFKASNSLYSVEADVLADLNISQTLFNKFKLLPLEDAIEDEEEELVTSEFSDAYKDFIGRGLSLSFLTNGSGEVELRWDPCGWQATSWLVLSSALEVALSASNPISLAWAGANTAYKIYAYARDCG